MKILIFLFFPFLLMAQTETRNHQIEATLYDSSGELFGYTVEAVEGSDGERVIYVSLHGGTWINSAQLKYYLWSLDCRKWLIGEGDFHRFVMVNDFRFEMRNCICKVASQLNVAMTQYKKG